MKKRNRRTLHAIVARIIYPGTTVVTDKWKGYDGPWTVHDELGHMVLNHLTVNHSENFVDPETGAHTQKIESAWTALKQDLLKRGKGTSKTLLSSHLTWYWWNSINGRTRCRDPFFRFWKPSAGGICVPEHAQQTALFRATHSSSSSPCNYV